MREKIFKCPKCGKELEKTENSLICRNHKEEFDEKNDIISKEDWEEGLKLVVKVNRDFLIGLAED